MIEPAQRIARVRFLSRAPIFLKLQLTYQDGVAVLAKWEYQEAALCEEYKLTPEQVAQAIRRCPAELLAERL